MGNLSSKYPPPTSPESPKSPKTDDSSPLTQGSPTPPVVPSTEGGSSRVAERWTDVERYRVLLSIIDAHERRRHQRTQITPPQGRNLAETEAMINDCKRQTGDTSLGVLTTTPMGQWTEAEKLQVLLAMIDSHGGKADWSKVKWPEARGLKATQSMVSQLRRKAAVAAGVPAGAPKKAATKAAKAAKPDKTTATKRKRGEEEGVEGGRAKRAKKGETVGETVEETAVVEGDEEDALFIERSMGRLVLRLTGAGPLASAPEQRHRGLFGGLLEVTGEQVREWLKEDKDSSSAPEGH